MRRCAIFSDIHGNLAALEAVLADIAGHGIDEDICLGDLVGYGPDPAEVVDRIRALEIPTVRGNYDDGVGFARGGCGCFYANPQAEQDGAVSYAFTEASLDDSARAWLSGLPSALRLDVEGVRLHFCHGSPRKINEYLLPDRADAQLARLADEVSADVVCVGHVHLPYHRILAAAEGRPVHYVSDGSVGKPKDGDNRACWAELVIGDEVAVRSAAENGSGPAGSSGAWVGTTMHRVAYDVESVVSRMLAVGLPLTLAEALRTA